MQGSVRRAIRRTLRLIVHTFGAGRFLVIIGIHPVRQGVYQIGADLKQFKQALESLEYIVNADWRKWEELASPEEFVRWAKSRANHTATSLRQAIAEAEKQEPVAYVTGVYAGRFTYAPIKASVVLPVGMAFYTHPQPKREWVGLTDEERQEVVNKKWWDWEDAFDIESFARAIEAKLKEKNT